MKREKGYIHVLFAGAGIGGVVRSALSPKRSSTRVFDLNVCGIFFTAQKAIPLCRDGGAILNGSIANVKGFPGVSVYGASKAAVRAFARGWLVDLKDRRFRVNVLSPGPIDTAAMQRLPAGAKDQFKAIIPRGELGGRRRSPQWRWFWHRAILAS